MTRSATVIMRLTVAGVQHSIRAMAPGYIVLRDAVTLPLCEGRVHLSIDGSESNWRVQLPDGADPARRKTRTAFPARRPHA